MKNYFFDIEEFVSELSFCLFPQKFRTEEIFALIKDYADIFYVSKDLMRTVMPRVMRSGEEGFDRKTLLDFCLSHSSEFVETGNRYDVPCVLFLMNKQEGKPVSEYDKKIIYDLYSKFYLTPEVINVVLEYALNKCDNKFISKFMEPVAADLCRSSIKTADEALKRINVGNEIKRQPPARPSRGTCPNCGGNLYIKNGRNGAFIGCSNYPSCKYTENLAEDEGINNPIKINGKDVSIDNYPSIFRLCQRLKKDGYREENFDDIIRSLYSEMTELYK